METHCQAQPKARRSKGMSLLHCHLLSISDGQEAPMVNSSIMSFRNNYFCMLFFQKNKKTNKKTQQLTLPNPANCFSEFAGSVLWLLLVIWICAFLLVKPCPLWNCVCSGTWTHSGPARALPPTLVAVDDAVEGSAGAVVTTHNGELVSAVQEDAPCLGFVRDKAP